MKLACRGTVYYFFDIWSMGRLKSSLGKILRKYIEDTTFSLKKLNFFFSPQTFNQKYIYGCHYGKKKQRGELTATAESSRVVINGDNSTRGALLLLFECCEILPIFLLLKRYISWLHSIHKTQTKKGVSLKLQKGVITHS